MGSIVAVVWTPSFLTIPSVWTPYLLSVLITKLPSSSLPIAPSGYTPMPSLARSTVVPSAVPATVILISSRIEIF
jgi:hypothetical protein